MSFELRPEMPAEGIPLSRRFTPEDLTRIYENLRRLGSPLGIVFGSVSVTPNTRLAHQASEFARDKGRFHSFHDRVFRAYFTEIRDIGKPEVVLDLVREEGLDPEELSSAIEQGTYSSRLADARRAGEDIGVSAVPTFIVNGTHRVVGAQSLDVFRNLAREIQQGR